jgi:hypothetical protein
VVLFDDDHNMLDWIVGLHALRTSGWIFRWGLNLGLERGRCVTGKS